MWKLFTRDGRYIGKDIKGILETLSPIRSQIVSGGLAEEYWLGEEVFLRQRSSSKSVRVLAIRVRALLEETVTKGCKDGCVVGAPAWPTGLDAMPPSRLPRWR